MDGDAQAEDPSDESVADDDPPHQNGGQGEPPKEAASARWIVELVVVVVVAVLAAMLLRTFVVATYSIPSGSMEPTLQIGDRIVVDKLSYHLHGIGRGDIVVFSTPPTENCAGPPVSDLVKRVIALPGEIIALEDLRPLRTRCTPPTAFPPAMSTSWATTVRTPATAATGGPSASRPSSARSICGSGPCRESGFSSSPDSAGDAQSRCRAQITASKPDPATARGRSSAIDNGSMGRWPTSSIVPPGATPLASRATISSTEPDTCT